MDRAAEMRSVYDTLKGLLPGAEGSASAAIAREMRILSAELAVIEKPTEVSKVDEMAARRNAKSKSARPPARRRQSG